MDRRFATINSTSIPVAGLGGIGMLTLAALIAIQFPLARIITFYGALAGLGIAALLIHLHRPRRNSRPARRA